MNASLGLRRTLDLLCTHAAPRAVDEMDAHSGQLHLSLSGGVEVIIRGCGVVAAHAELAGVTCWRISAQFPYAEP